MLYIVLERRDLEQHETILSNTRRHLGKLLYERDHYSYTSRPRAAIEKTIDLDIDRISPQRAISTVSKRHHPHVRTAICTSDRDIDLDTRLYPLYS